MKDLLTKAKVHPDRISGDAEIRAVTSDSRQVNKGALFICMPSSRTDSHDFLHEAKARGAVAALCHHGAGYQSAIDLNLASILVENETEFRDALWKLVSTYYGSPASKLQTFGVTGTNGKTTTAWIIRDLLNAMALPCSYLGTLGCQLPNQALVPLPNTTPFAPDLQQLLHEMATKYPRSGLAVEVSSHALEERRIDGTLFDVAVFTNLSQDHLDFHETMEAYGAAKARLFGIGTDDPSRFAKSDFRAVINSDDVFGRFLIANCPFPTISFGSDPTCDLQIKSIEVELTQCSLKLKWSNREFGVTIPVGGKFNALNTVAAIAALLAKDFDVENVARAARSISPVPGRFEAISEGGLTAIVDYAHTPDALEQLLKIIRPLTSGKVIVVFGCGGDRDRSKRSHMGRAASQFSDRCIVTNDNPRSEDPQAIANDILQGVSTSCEVILNRREAVFHAITHASQGDTVVVAGKGHENYQILGSERIHLDDRELVRESLKLRFG